MIMQKTYDEIRATYSCALPTEQELRDFFGSMECYLAIDEHKGKKNLVLYFTPFRGKFLNYVRCFNNSVKTNSAICQSSLDLVKKRNHNSSAIYVYIASQRYRGNSFLKKVPGRELIGDVVGIDTDDNKREDRFPWLRGNHVLASYGNPSKILLDFANIFLLSEVEARRGFKILRYNVQNEETLDTDFHLQYSRRKIFAFIECWLLPYTIVRRMTSNMWVKDHFTSLNDDPTF